MTVHKMKEDDIDSRKFIGSYRNCIAVEYSEILLFKRGTGFLQMARSKTKHREKLGVI